MAHDPKTLTKKQELFCQEYLKDLNGSGAYKRAGYNSQKPRAISESAARLLRKPEIKARVDELIAERSKRTAVDADWVLERLVDEVQADLADLYNADMTLKSVHEWPKIWRQGLVSALETTVSENGAVQVTRIKLSDRTKLLELIGKHVNVSAFAERSVVTGNNGGPIEYAILPVSSGTVIDAEPEPDD